MLHVIFLFIQDIYAVAGDWMECPRHHVDFRAKRRMQPRILFHHRRRSPGVLRLDPDRSQYFRSRPGVRSDRFPGETAVGEFRGARQDLAHLATQIQVPVVDAQGRERKRDLSTCRW